MFFYHPWLSYVVIYAPYINNIYCILSFSYELCTVIFFESAGGFWSGKIDSVTNFRCQENVLGVLIPTRFYSIIVHTPTIILWNYALYTYRQKDVSQIR